MSWGWVFELQMNSFPHCFVYVVVFAQNNFFMIGNIKAIAVVVVLSKDIIGLFFSCPKVNILRDEIWNIIRHVSRQTPFVTTAYSLKLSLSSRAIKTPGRIKWPQFTSPKKVFLSSISKCGDDGFICSFPNNFVYSFVWGNSSLIFKPWNDYGGRERLLSVRLIYIEGSIRPMLEWWHDKTILFFNTY